MKIVFFFALVAPLSVAYGDADVPDESPEEPLFFDFSFGGGVMNEQGLLPKNAQAISWSFGIGRSVSERTDVSFGVTSIGLAPVLRRPDRSAYQSTLFIKARTYLSDRIFVFGAVGPSLSYVRANSGLDFSLPEDLRLGIGVEAGVGIDLIRGETSSLSAVLMAGGAAFGRESAATYMTAGLSWRF